MSSLPNVVLASAVVAPLLYLYILFLSWLVSGGALPGSNYIELSLVVTQVARVGLVISVRRLRTASVALVADLFALEVFSFPILIALYFWFRDPSALALAFTIVGAWPAAVLCVVPAYVIFRIVSSMGRNRRLMSVLPPAVALFALFAFLSYLVLSEPAPRGLTALSSLLLSSVLRMHSIDVTSPVVLASIPLYLSLLTYAATQGGGMSAAKNNALILVVLGTSISIGLSLFAAYVAIYPLLIFGVPGTLLITMVWWITRAR